MSKEQIEKMAYNILEDYTSAYSIADKDVLTRYLRHNFEQMQSDLYPCDVCRFNPPSSGDGKPCTVCPAQKKGGAG